MAVAAALIVAVVVVAAAAVGSRLVHLGQACRSQRWLAWQIGGYLVLRFCPFWRPARYAQQHAPAASSSSPCRTVTGEIVSDKRTTRVDTLDRSDYGPKLAVYQAMVMVRLRLCGCERMGSTRCEGDVQVVVQ